MLQDKLLSKSGDYITTVVQESAPRMGKDGLMSMTTEAVVNVKALQKSLNQMSRDERIEFIRASGDPKIVGAHRRARRRSAGRAARSPRRSPRTCSRSASSRSASAPGRTTATDGGRQGADFAVQGEAKIKKLSMRLEASGLVITKYTLTSWTVKCIDRDDRRGDLLQHDAAEGRRAAGRARRRR